MIAGGKGLICILKGCLAALEGVESDVASLKSDSDHGPAQAVINTDDIRFAYCTEFIIEGDGMNGAALKAKIEQLGDSMVFVQDEELIKVHIHTNNPGIALEEALKHGMLKKVKIENMRDQHSNIIEGAHDKTEDSAVEQKPQTPHDEKYGFIAVAMGEGFVNIFSDLGIHGSIAGGQTMNPSTEDFLREIDKCPSEYVFLFPNNSNIIMAANQAKALSERNVYVIPSKTMPQCISAMLEFNHDADVEENCAAMTEALSRVKTIQVTYSVRDTKFDGMVIEKDDFPRRFRRNDKRRWKRSAGSHSKSG